MSGLQYIFSPYLWVVGLTSLALYFLCLAIFRLYLSPIAKFPGPKLAALTLWYEFYHDVVRGGQYLWKIRELHDIYGRQIWSSLHKGANEMSAGPVIRINPYELHIMDPEFYDQLYAGPTSRRDKWAWPLSMFGNSESMFGTVPHDHHRLRRVPLNPYFSKQSVTRLEPLIRGTIEKLCGRFEELRKSGELFEIGRAYTALTTDIITTYSFSKTYGCIDDPNWKHEWPDAMFQGSKSCHLNKQFKWVLPMMQATPEWIVKRLNPAVMNIINFQRVIRQSPSCLDRLS